MELLARHKRAFLLSGIGLCILAIILTVNPRAGSNFISSGLSYIITPMQRGLSSAIGWVQGHFTALTGNQRLLALNRELALQNNQLRLDNYRLRLAAQENDMLSEILNMRRRYALLPTVGARVIGQDPNDFQRSLHIDRGTSEGVEVGMAAISDGGLAGVVRYVHPNRAQVITVVDSRFAAAVMSVRTEDVGTVRGDIRLMQQGRLRMDHIEAAAQIMPGDEIITSSHSTVFPPGILVGTVISIHQTPNGLARYALIEPAANLSDVEILLIVTEVFGEGYSEEARPFGLEE